MANGVVGRALRFRERYDNDPIFRKRIIESATKVKTKNKNYYRNFARKRTEKLNIFANKRCGLCGKLLNYRSKWNICHECYISNHAVIGRPKK